MYLFVKMEQQILVRERSSTSKSEEEEVVLIIQVGPSQKEPFHLIFDQNCRNVFCIMKSTHSFPNDLPWSS